MRSSAVQWKTEQPEKSQLSNLGVGRNLPKSGSVRVLHTVLIMPQKHAHAAVVAELFASAVRVLMKRVMHRRERMSSNVNRPGLEVHRWRLRLYKLFDCAIARPA